ncbi:MAG: hypothetical protein ACLUIQ_06630 [Dialister invisus]
MNWKTHRKAAREETKDPGYEDGAEGGSLVGEALPGKGLEKYKSGGYF